jgi:hypothetical protein
LNTDSPLIFLAKDMSESQEDSTTLHDGVSGQTLTKPTTLDDPVPDCYKSIWDCPFLSRVTVMGTNKYGDQVSKKEVFCWHCKRQLKGGWNATKALAHVAKKSGHDVKPCHGNMTKDRTNCYKNMYFKFIGRKIRSESARDQINADADRHDASALRIAASRKTMATSSAISRRDASSGSSFASHPAPRVFN